MKKIKIRQANISELNQVLDFIKCNWNKNHILLKNNNVLNTYYKDKKRLNFFIAKDKTKVVGIIGYIKNENFNSKKNSIVWPSILQSLDNYPGVGFQLVVKLINKFKKSNIGFINANHKSEKLFRLIGFESKVFHHYYLINSKKIRFNLLKIKNRNINFKKRKPKIDIKFKYINNRNIKKIDNFNFYEKNNVFLEKKYLRSKFYKYYVIKIMDKKKENESIIVFRIIKHKQSSCIRVVDYIGNYKNMIKAILLFHYILFKYNAEYLDFYTSEKFTDDEEKYINKNSYNNSIIIPNYYEPFIQSNVKVRYGIFANKKKNNFLFFKGEGDGERPNLI